MSKVVTRFAPSPTGLLHAGGLRTALFSWLAARHGGGKFILRIEDTDRSRHVKEAEGHIEECLRWLGIDWDEKYRQGDRLGIYSEWAAKLLGSGRAYADPRSPDELEKMRESFNNKKQPVLFRESRPPKTEWHEGVPVRFLSEPKKYGWKDEVLGELSSTEEAVDDFIILKSDGWPTYNFAHVIDDYLMGITHVFRSQEFTSSVPKFLNLMEALEIHPPSFVTLPYVLSPDGNKKLSKREGAKDLLWYQKQGFLPEAMMSFLATIGWNDGTEQEIYTVADLIAKFEARRIHKGGAHFDEQRLKWINGSFIRQKPLEELFESAQDYWPDGASAHDERYRMEVLRIHQQRLKYLDELKNLTGYFFSEPEVRLELIKDDNKLSKLSSSELVKLLETSTEVLRQSTFETEDLKLKLNNLLEETSQKPAVLFNLIRIAITWSESSPPLPETMAVLGMETVLSRIAEATKAI